MGSFHANTETISNLYTICVGTFRISQLPIKQTMHWIDGDDGKMQVEWESGRKNRMPYHRERWTTHTNENGRDRKRTKQPKYEIWEQLKTNKNELSSRAHITGSTPGK